MEGKTQLTKFTFYDLYAELMDTLTDEERGKLLRTMCAYAFEDAPPSLTDKKLVYLWGDIVDTLSVDKEAQESGRTPKGLNRQMKHFMFHRNFYEALPLMDDKQAGQFAKAVYNYALNEQEPLKLTSPVDTYYKLAKRKLQLSKMRSKIVEIGKIGGNAPRVKIKLLPNDEVCAIMKKITELMIAEAEMKDFYKRLMALGMGAMMIFGMSAMAGCDNGEQGQTPSTGATTPDNDDGKDKDGPSVTPDSGKDKESDDDPTTPPATGKKTLAEAKAELEAFMKRLTNGNNFTYTDRAAQQTLEFDGQKLKKTAQGAITYYDATTEGQTFSYTANEDDGWDKDFSDFDINAKINSIKNIGNSITWTGLDQNDNLIGRATVNHTNASVTATVSQDEVTVVSKAEVTGQVLDDITINNIGTTAVVIPTEKINDKTVQKSDLLYTEVDGERVWNVKLIADTFMKNLPIDYFNVGSIEYLLKKILYVNVENNTLHIGAYLGGENPCFLAYKTRSQFATSLTSGEMETKDQLINYIKTADYNKPLISEGSLIHMDYATGVDATEEEEQEFAILSQNIVDRLVSVGVQPGDIDVEGEKKEELTDGQVIFGCMGPVKNTTSGHHIGNYALFDVVLIVKVDNNYKLVKANVCSSIDLVENGKTNVLNNNSNRWLVQKCEIEDISKENAVLYETVLQEGEQ